MRNRKIERMTLVAFSLAACMAFALAAGPAQARSVGAGAMGRANRGRSGSPVLDGAPSMQPHFNPSIFTVPQSPETPVSPGSPGSVFGPR